MNYETIEFDILENGIGQLTLNRPAAYNAVNHKMMEELESFWRDRLYDLDTVLVILRGAGDKGFCAGLDMKEMGEQFANFTVHEMYRFQARLARINLHMRRAPQPIIAAVHGSAAGQGFSMVLASDIRIISEDARFSAAYINIGLGGADMSCSYFLPRAIGTGRAYEYMYTGKFMSAQEAFQLGMVTQVVKREELMPVAMDYAHTLIGKNHFALRLTKEAINMNIDAVGLEQALNMEDRNQILLSVASGVKQPLK